jgi:hypothetical protein
VTINDDDDDNNNNNNNIDVTINHDKHYNINSFNLTSCLVACECGRVSHLQTL